MFKIPTALRSRKPFYFMQKMYLLAALCLTLAAACNDNKLPKPQNTPATAGLQMVTDADAAWSHENLRLYPVVADAELLAKQADLATVMTLSSAMETPGFRITEKKQFGREENWQHALTVQNKTQDTIVLLSGDVVTGGNQDRVIAYHQVVLPRSVKNIEVFCVEAGRSSYYNQNASPAEKQVAAFKGYYNMASPQVRQAVQSGNQSGVWAAVAKVTEANNASSSTKTYAALDTETEAKARRDAYLQHFQGAFAQLPGAVGVVAVCNGKVLAVDIFGHPKLFQQQIGALVHGYVAEAATAGSDATADQEAVKKAFQRVAWLAKPGTKGDASTRKFSLGDKWIHLYGAL